MRVRIRKPRRPRVGARPAETVTGVAGAITVLVAAVFDITDRDVLIALPVLIAAIPGAVTALMEWSGARQPR